MNYRFEIIFIFLYDVGRSVDLKGLAEDFRKGHDRLSESVHRERRVDTPESLLLPHPLILVLDDSAADAQKPESGGFSRIQIKGKVYEDGVVTIECRAEITIEFTQIHTIRSRLMLREGEAHTLDSLCSLHFQRLMGRISSRVRRDQYYFDPPEREDYRVFCLIDPVDNPADLVEKYRSYLAPFLLGENPAMKLHESQISATLRTPFSFTETDLAIFDMDRAFIIDPASDYEDLLLIVEHATYQLLELRTLDILLDRLLDEAERDIPGAYKKRGRGLLAFNPFRNFGALSQKLDMLQPLRLDALFVLENLENSSRIIGDYYLEQIYDHLCTIFNTLGWKSNIERRLDILQSIYSLTKADITDRTMVGLEFLVALMIAVELVVLFFPLIK